jgi:hypothetical protein
MLPLPIAYADIHYRTRFLVPFYYRKAPEIVVDCPRRIIRPISSELPLALVIKDAHRFPITLDDLRITVHTGTRRLLLRDIELSERIDIPYSARLIRLSTECLPSDTELDVRVRVRYQLNCLHCECMLHNLPGIPSTPLKCRFHDQFLPYPDNAYPGDLHYHSSFTSDQIEYGADLDTTRQMGLASGLRWVGVTDHSYDLDDRVDDFLRNDPALPKWRMMQNACASLSDEAFRFLPGEELSVGNTKRENIHLLVFGRTDFLPGKGDSAEKWFVTDPDLTLHDLPKDGLYIPAHPAEKATFGERLFFRRGNWSDEELSRFTYLQIINGRLSQSGLAMWKRRLAHGQRAILLAGNDAHGDFNTKRYVRFPMFYLDETAAHVFGRWQTVFHSDGNAPLIGLQNRHLFVTTGPYLDFRLHTTEGDFRPGEVATGVPLRIDIDARSSQELGAKKAVRVHVGTRDGEKAYPTGVLPTAFPREGYIRVSLRTEQNERALSNPVWFNSR